MPSGTFLWQIHIRGHLVIESTDVDLVGGHETLIPATSNQQVPKISGYKHKLLVLTTMATRKVNRVARSIQTYDNVQTFS